MEGLQRNQGSPRILAYKKVEKFVKDAVRKAKQNFEKKLAKDVKKNPKAFYSYLKSRTSNRVTVGPLKDGVEIVTDNNKMAEMLNGFFSSVFTQEDVSDIPTPTPVYTGPDPLQSTPFQLNWSRIRLTNSAHQQPRDLTKYVQNYFRQLSTPLLNLFPSFTPDLSG